MSTMQQVGYALGVAVTGVIFFGAADDGIAHAFQLSLIQLAAVSAGIVMMARLLPGNAPRPASIGTARIGHEPDVTQTQQTADTVVTGMECARIDISQDLDGHPVVHACFDLTGPSRSPRAAHAVACQSLPSASGCRSCRRTRCSSCAS